MSRRVTLLALAAGAVWLAGLGAYPLTEPTEGRYASIAAAMARSGDWLEPRFGGALHLDKPPLAYWAGGVAVRVLSTREFAIRLPATLAWLAVLVLLVRVAQSAGLDRRRALWAAAFAGLSPLAAVQAHLLSSDIFLWLGVVLCQWAWFDAASDRATRAIRMGTGLGVGFVAKGPVVLLWTVLPALVAAAIGRRRSLLAPFVATRTAALFAALGLPWFVLEALRQPDVAGFWLRREIAARFLTTVHGRSEPWWYFLALLPVLVLPWLPETVRGVARAVRAAPVHEAPSGAMHAALAMAAVPLLLLCFSGSKRANYLLPMLGPLALIAAAALPERRSRLARVWGGVWLLVLLAGPFCLAHVQGAVAPTRAIARAASVHGGPIVAYRVLPSSLPFYAAGEVATCEVGVVAEFRVRGEPSAADAAATLPATLEAGGTVVARARDQPDAERAAGQTLHRIAASGALVLLGAE